MNILHAKTQVLLDGQEVFARGITSTDEYLTMQGAEVPPLLGAQTVRVVYPDGAIWEMPCDARMESDDAGNLEYRYYFQASEDSNVIRMSTEFAALMKRFEDA